MGPHEERGVHRDRIDIQVPARSSFSRRDVARMRYRSGLRPDMAKTETSARHQPSPFQTLRQDAQHLWTELNRIGFKRTMDRTFRELQDFYLEHT